MPVVKVKPSSDSPKLAAGTKRTRKRDKHVGVPRDGTINKSTPVGDLPCDPSVEYPLDGRARAAFRTCDGKKVTENQWAIYDFTRTIPPGRVTTYMALCKALGKGSPRSVGSALRHNPFAPFVPCHRVIASNLYIGGFFGEWGTSSRKRNGTIGEKCQKKIELLEMEGVQFSVDGYLADEHLIWRG